MNTDIPIYRAELDSDQLVFASAQELERALTWIRDRGYVIGLPNHNGEMMVELKDTDGNKHISVFYYKKETLSIHFPGMIASDSDRLLPNGEKDLRIFASLNDGKGGDIIRFDNGVDIRDILVMYQYLTVDFIPIKIIKDSYQFKGMSLNDPLTIIGIQQ